MPNIKSAKKRAKQSLTRAATNAQIKSKLKTQFKKIEKLIEDKKSDEAITVLSAYFKLIDKAVGKGVIKKNTAARNKSRLSIRISKLTKS